MMIFYIFICTFTPLHNDHCVVNQTCGHSGPNERCIYGAQLIRRVRPKVDAVADVAVECVRDATVRLCETGRQENQNHCRRQLA